MEENDAKFSNLVFIDNYNLTSSKLNFFPDPFSPNGEGKCEETTLFLTYPSFTSVRVNIYNMKGLLVKKLFEGDISGNKSIFWNGADDFGKSCPVGVYIFQVRAGADVKSGTVVVSK